MLLQRNRVANASVRAWHCARRFRGFIAAMQILCSAVSRGGRGGQAAKSRRWLGGTSAGVGSGCGAFERAQGAARCCAGK
jgi:hypothetical protein